MFLYRCASCGSDRVQLRDVNEGFSYGKAALGTVAFGTVGAVAGLAGKKTTKYYCPTCGQTLNYPMNATQAFHIDEELMHRADPNHINTLRALKNTYPGIDWKDPDEMGSLNSVQVVKERPEINPNATTEALLERISGFIEDREWDNANYYCEYLLDKEPSNPEIYKNKILIENQSADIYELGLRLDENHSSLEGSSYNKFLKYGGDEAEKWCDEVNEIKRSYLSRRIEARKREKYDSLVSTMDSYSIASMGELLNTSVEFDKLGDYEDSKDRSQKCMELYQQLQSEAEEDRKKKNVADEESKLFTATDERTAASARDQLIWLTNEKEKYDDLYEKRLDEINKDKKGNTIKIVVAVAVGAIIVSAIGYYFGVVQPRKKYNTESKPKYDRAVSEESNGNYVDALTTFRTIDKYADAQSHIDSIKQVLIEDSQAQKNSGNYVDALLDLHALIELGYEDEYNTMAEEAFHEAKNQVEQENYEVAENILTQLNKFNYEASNGLLYDVETALIVKNANSNNEIELPVIIDRINNDISDPKIKERVMKYPLIADLQMIEGNWTALNENNKEISISIDANAGTVEGRYDYDITYYKGKYFFGDKTLKKYIDSFSESEIVVKDGIFEYDFKRQ